MTDPIDRMLTLPQAAEHYGLKLAEVETERRRGNLVVTIVGRDGRYTTHADMQEMLRARREEGLRRRKTSLALRWRGTASGRRSGTKRPFPDLPPPK
jgi:hypothetical protein